MRGKLESSSEIYAVDCQPSPFEEESETLKNRNSTAVKPDEMEPSYVEEYGHWIYMLYHFSLKETVDWLLECAQRPWISVKTFLLLFTVNCLDLIRPRKGKNNNKQDCSSDYSDPDTVYLHIFPRSYHKNVVNLSPYAIKVETWCRMNNIQYKAVETSRFSPREGQMPWIMLNGRDTADSGAIIDVLRKHFKVTTPAPLSPEMEAVQRAASRMMDDSFAGLYLWYRYTVEAQEFKKYFQATRAPKFFRPYILDRMGQGMRTRAVNLGFARYGVEHSIRLGEKDLRALSDLLGSKDYFLGDRPSELDATVFGHLSQILYPGMPYPWKSYITENCHNLSAFCERVKTQFWPDWDSLVSTGLFK